MCLWHMVWPSIRFRGSGLLLFKPVLFLAYQIRSLKYVSSILLVVQTATLYVLRLRLFRLRRWEYICELPNAA